MLIRPFFVVLLTLISSQLFASHHPQEFLHHISGAKDEGEQIVQQFCVNCHAEKPLIALGAPRINSRSDWLPRLKPGFKTLLQHSDEGLNAMPPRGGCFECSDKQLVLAILAMLPEAERKDLLAGLGENGVGE